MLEILYEKETKRVAGWRSTVERMGKMITKDGQSVVVLPIGVPAFESDNCYIDLDKQIIFPDPAYIPPPDYKAEWKKARECT